MALIYPGITCPLCGKVIEPDADLFATSGTFFPPEHPLFRFCDAALHWDCYAAWPDRREFARQYFRACLAAAEQNPYWGVVFASDEVFVELRPQPPMARVNVHLAETGTAIPAPFAGWADWLEDEEAAVWGRPPLEQQALRRVLPLLLREVPDRSSLMSRLDWGVQRVLLQKFRGETRERRLAQASQARLHNEVCEAARRKGAACPHCGERQKIRFVDRRPERKGKSYFVCGGCARSFGPSDLRHMGEK